jgi:hypothetical protein
MWYIFLSLLLTASTSAFEAQTLDGRTLLGSLTELTADRLILQTPEGRVALATEQLLTLSLSPKPAAAAVAPGAWIELIDGSTIVASDYAVQGAQARITLLDGEVLETPADMILAVRLQAQTAALAEQWSKILDKKLDGDLLIVRRDDNLDYHQGVLLDVMPDLVKFQLDGDVLPIKRDKIYGFVYRHSARGALPGPICSILDDSGSRWQARNIDFQEKIHWTTPAGLTLSRRPEAVALIDFSRGKIIYLSDLKPESIAWTPPFGTTKTLPSWEQFYAPRQDRTFASKALQLAGKEYGKGLAIHSRTEIVYRLPGSFRRLKAIAGIDDSLRPRGNVRLLIRGDNKTLLDALIAGTDKPLPIDLDISGMRRLSILVDFGNRLSFGDNLDLCNARIIK